MRAASARRTAARAVGCLFGQIGLFSAAIYAVAMCTPLHIFLLDRLGTAARVGLGEDALAEIARAMTAAMRGEGVRALSRFFGPDEVAHMRDVRALVVFAQRWIASCLALFAAGMLLSRGLSRARSARAAGAALLLCAASAGAVAFAFAKDFYGAFVAFHRLFFRSNELWLMDPATDFMVVVYDERFFMWAAGCAGALCALSLIPLLCIFLRGGEAFRWITNRAPASGREGCRNRGGR